MHIEVSMYVWEYVCVERRDTRGEKISGNTYSIYYTHVGGFFSTPAHSIPYVGARGDRRVDESRERGRRDSSHARNIRGSFSAI